MSAATRGTYYSAALGLEYVTYTEDSAVAFCGNHIEFDFRLTYIYPLIMQLCS